ncbi:pyrroline-5-carboxylate reductase-like [Halichondria panicea]|uniref:pyrroline-5-carboxylate reductase-like n=1 Tax=Halichondria panicea TaxID=6063 RepID=UPI00312B43BC
MSKSTSPSVVLTATAAVTKNTTVTASGGGRSLSTRNLTGSGPPPVKRARSSSLIQQTKQPGLGKWAIGFIGAGNMARAITEGLIGSAQVSPSQITASATSANSENLKKMKALGVNATTSNNLVMTSSDIIIIAVKPHHVLSVLSDLHDCYVSAQSSGNPPKNLRPLIVSVAAAITITDIESKTSVSWQITGYPVKGHLPVIRCLPTLGTAINAGITAYTKGRYCNEDDVEPFLFVFGLVSHCEEVEEKHMNAFAAFGSGIAFMAVALEALADGGVMAGIPRALSQRVAAHTMLSTAQLVIKKKLHPAEVKDAVASPAGTTISGLQCLESSGFRGAIMTAIKTAANRADEMNPSLSKT